MNQLVGCELGKWLLSLGLVMDKTDTRSLESQEQDREARLQELLPTLTCAVLLVPNPSEKNQTAQIERANQRLPGEEGAT